MELTAKLNAKFYVVTVLLLCLILFVLHGIYFLNANPILMEEGTPMSAETKGLFTVLMSIILLSWILSFVSMLRQILLGCAFKMDENGIHSTLTAFIFLSFILVVPVKEIPYSAIDRVDDTQIHFDKKQISSYPVLRLFVRKQYGMFEGFTGADKSEIKKILDSHTNPSK